MAARRREADPTVDPLRRGATARSTRCQTVRRAGVRPGYALSARDGSEHMAAWDSIKSAFRTITGTTTSVTLRVVHDVVLVGEHVEFEIGLRAAQSPVEARALLVDVVAREEVRATLGTSADGRMHRLVNPQDPLEVFGFPRMSPVEHSSATFERAAKVCGPLVLREGEERTFRARAHIPSDAQPTYRGRYATHGWSLRARLDVLGTDPTSEWQTIVVCRPAVGAPVRA